MAADAEDISVFSTYLQDAVLKVGDMAYLPKERRFAFVTNRFVWEDGASKTFGPFVRVRSGVHFDDVIAVRSQNIKLDAKTAVLSLLAVKVDDEGERITLEFSGGGVIELQVAAVTGSMNDISDPWRTQSKPDHGLS